MTVNVSDEVGGTSRSARKRRAILAAAQGVFLDRGYLGTNMDEIAALSGASKQTVYKHFGSKEALFVEIVRTMTAEAGDAVQQPVPAPEHAEELAPFLRDYALRQLTVVLTPQLMRLRRLVIGEVGRFPELARALYDGGPRRAMAGLAELFTLLADRGLLTVPDPALAASHFNWLVMSAPVNEAMLLGDEAIPDEEELRRYATEGVRVFLAAYGRRVDR